MVLMASAALGPGLKFLIVAALGVPVCFLAGYALTRLRSIARAHPASVSEAGAGSGSPYLAR
jgi:hypothetical protein